VLFRSQVVLNFVLQESVDGSHPGDPDTEYHQVDGSVDESTSNERRAARRQFGPSGTSHFVDTNDRFSSLHSCL